MGFRLGAFLVFAALVGSKARANDLLRELELPFKLGQTDCVRGLERLHSQNLELCKTEDNYLSLENFPESPAHQMTKSGPEVCTDHADHRFALSLQRYKRFRQVPEPCSRVAYRVNDWIKEAYQLELKEPVEFKKDEPCPLVLIYEEEILEPTHSPATLPFACYNGKVALFAKRVSQPPPAIAESLTKRFGRVLRLSVKKETGISLPSGKPQPLYRFTHFFRTSGMHVLLISFSKTQGRDFGQNKFLIDSFILFFSDEYLKIHLANYAAMKARIQHVSPKK